MAVEIASAYVTVIPTTKGIAAGLEKELVGPLNAAAKKGGDEAGKTMKASLADSSASFTKFGIGALAVAGAVGTGLFKAGEAASDLGESVNAVQVTFGSAAGGILKLGEDAATSMGLSNAAFNGLAVQFSAFATTIAGKGGDVVATMKELTGRAADFASVMNIDVKDAATLFQSGLAGETEPLRKYGIDLSAAAVKAFAAAHGIGTLGKELTESEKVTARYQLLMESTAKTQGDFANTSDSAANATRIAKAELENASASLGAVVAPVLAEVATKVAGLAKGFVSLNESTGGALISLTAMAGGAALLLGVASTTVGAVSKMSAAFHTAEGGLNAFGKAGKALAGPLAILAVVAVGLTLRAGHAADALKRIADNAAELSAVADKDVLNVLNKSLAQGVANGVSLDETMKTLASTNLEGAKRALELAEANGTNQKVVDSLRAAIAAEDAAVAQTAKTTEEFATKTDDLTDSTGDLTTETLDMTAATAAADAVLKGVAAATEEAQRKSDAFAESLVNQRQKTEDLYGKEFDAIQAKHDLADATTQADADVTAMNETLKKHKAGTEEATAATDTAYDSIVNVAEQYGTLNGAALGSDQSIRRQIDSLTLQASAMAPGSPLRARLEQYIAELAAIPSKVATTVSLNISVGQVATAAGDIIGLGTVSFAGQFKPHARGGPASGRILAGEEGPEFIDVPPGSFVHTAQATRAMQSATSSLVSAGGVPPIVVNNNRRDIGVGDLNQILAMARLAA